MKHYYNNVKTNRGITLIELVVVISIISILFICSFKGLLIAKENIDLNRAAHQLEATIQSCHSKAFYSGIYYKIEFQPMFDRYRIFRGTDLKRVVNLDNINLHYTNFTDYKVRLLPNGCPSMGGTVTLKNKSGKTLYVITTPVTARTRISDKPPENW